MTYRFSNTSTVTLLVGENKAAFHVHLDVLCDASPFFKAAFLGSFRESSEKTMQLPEDDEDTFELFVGWLYCQRYELLPGVETNDEKDDNKKGDEANVDEDDERFLQAFRLFTLADKYEIFKLKNLIIETLFVDGGGETYGPDITSIAYAYGHTTQGSGLRKLLADWCAWNSDRVWYERPKVQALLRQQPDFATDVVLSFARNMENGEGWNPFEGDMPEEYKDKSHVQEIRALRRQPEEPPQGPTGKSIVCSWCLKQS